MSVTRTRDRRFHRIGMLDGAVIETVMAAIVSDSSSNDAADALDSSLEPGRNDAAKIRHRTKATQTRSVSCQLMRCSRKLSPRKCFGEQNQSKLRARSRRNQGEIKALGPGRNDAARRRVYRAKGNEGPWLCKLDSWLCKLKSWLRKLKGLLRRLGTQACSAATS
jgi:hypothetical protein